MVLHMYIAARLLVHKCSLPPYRGREREHCSCAVVHYSCGTCAGYLCKSLTKHFRGKHAAGVMSQNLKASTRPPLTINLLPPGGEAVGADAPAPGERRPVYVGRLDTIADWKRALGKIFRATRKGEISSSEGARLTYIANSGVQAAATEERIALEKRRIEAEEENARQIELLRRKVEEVRGDAPSTPMLEREPPAWLRDDELATEERSQ